MGSHENYLVRVSCMTYNQSAYITDAMNGFTMQQTDFPFVCTIVDDASTDGEQEVIRNYLKEQFDLQNTSVSSEKDTDYGHVTFAQHKTNKNCFFAVILLKENHYSQKKSKALYLTEWMDTKYVALCEGDDYWTDPLKLQRQVDFLEMNVAYSASAENGLVLYTSSQTTGVFSKESTKDVTFEELLIKRRFPTASVVYKACYSKGMESLIPPRFDTLIWAYLAKQGKIHYNQVVSSVYRRGCGITSHDRIKWAYVVRSFNISLNKNFSIPDEINRIRKLDVFENILEGLKEAKRQKRYADVFRLFCYGIELFPKRMLKMFVKGLK
jgi:glycosyltransferase involved in cell wall biosynthesis